jgi:hypothetical protein
VLLPRKCGVPTPSQAQLSGALSNCTQTGVTTKTALAFNSFWAIISGSRLEKIRVKIYFYGNSK